MLHLDIFNNFSVGYGIAPKYIYMNKYKEGQCLCGWGWGHRRASDSQSEVVGQEDI
jgi:hypothetical protein